MARQGFRKQPGIYATREDLQKLAEVQQAPQVIGRRGLPQPGGVGNIFAQEPAAPVVGQPEIQAPIVQQAGQGTVLKEPELPIGTGTVMQAPMSEQFAQMGIQQGGFMPQQPKESIAAPTSPQANFEARMSTGLPLTEQEIGQAQQLAASMGTTFDPQAGYSREPFLAQQAFLAEKPQFARDITPFEGSYVNAQGQTVGLLNEGGQKVMTPEEIQSFQSANQMLGQPDQQTQQAQKATGSPTFGGIPVSEALKTGPQLDPQGRFIPEGFETREQALEAQGIQIPERTQTASVGLQGNRGPLTYGGHTKHELREMVGGGKRLRQAMAFARAGRDPITGKPMEQPQGPTAQDVADVRFTEARTAEIMANIEAGKKPDATGLEKRTSELSEALSRGIISEGQYEDQLKRQVLGNPPMGYDTWAEYENRTGTDADGDGKIAGDAEAGTSEPTDSAAPHGQVVVQGGQTYVWNSTTGEYVAKK